MDEDSRDYRVSFAMIQNTMGLEYQQSVDSGMREIANLINTGVICIFDDPEYKKMLKKSEFRIRSDVNYRV